MDKILSGLAIKAVSLVIILFSVTICNAQETSSASKVTETAQPEKIIDCNGEKCPKCQISNKEWSAPSDEFLFAVPIIVVIVALLGIAQIKIALGKESGWSLSDALSEDVKLPYWETDTSGKRVLKVDSNQALVLVPQMRASSSRLIALMGMIVLLSMFMGFGSFILYSFGKNGCLPDQMDEMYNFLIAGMALFAPYLVNKSVDLFKHFKKGT